MNPRRLPVGLALAVTMAGCSSSTGDPAAPTIRDLGSVVIAADEPRAGMTLSDAGDGRAALEQLPLFPDTASRLRAAPGFVEGRWSRFAGTEADFEDSRGFILTWVVRFEPEENARQVVSVLLNELQSDDHYGWGIGEDAGLGDEGTCLDGKNPQMGGLPETICVWRRGPLVMVVGGGIDNETPIRDEAAAMDARGEQLRP